MTLKRVTEKQCSHRLTASNHLKSTKEKANPINENKTAYNASSTAKKIQHQLDEQLQSCKDTDSFEVIIQLNCDLKKDKKKVDKILGNSIVPDHFFTFINAFSATLTADQIRKLSLEQDVKLIEQNITLSANIDTANRWFGTEKARRDFDLSGSGVTIAILDTGIDTSHVDLNRDKVIGWTDFVNGRTTPYDDEGHGTHVASIAAGRGSADARYRGVAPDASLVGIKVLNASGSGSMTNMIRGVEWLIEHKNEFNIQIANLSLGTSQSSNGRDALSQAVNVAVNYGITVVVAAGNAGPSKYTIGTPGAAHRAITVGSMADIGEMGFFQSLFSSRGPTSDGRIKPDVSAPGHRITAARANSTNRYVTHSGTSMAAPFVAGTVALMLQVNPSLSPEQVKQLLIESCEDWGKRGRNIDYGAGRLRAYVAIRAAGNLRGAPPTTPNHIQQTGRLSATRARELWEYQVNSRAHPISITMIQEDAGTDFDLYVYDTNGRLIAHSDTTARQEVVSFQPSSTDDYVIEVYSYLGRGNYYLDISGG